MEACEQGPFKENSRKNISTLMQRTRTCNQDFPSRGEVQGVQETQPPILFDGNMTNQMAPPVRCQAGKEDLACIYLNRVYTW